MSNAKKDHGYHHFMTHKDFHPANWKNLKAVRKFPNLFIKTIITIIEKNSFQVFEAREAEKLKIKLAKERDEEYKREQDDLNDAFFFNKKFKTIIKT